MTASELFFDTWAWIEIFQGSPNAEALWEQARTQRVRTSILSLAEVSAYYAGVATAQERENALAFIESHSKIQNVTPDHARLAGLVRAELRKNATRASLIDALILAAAREAGATLVSGDRAFADRG